MAAACLTASFEGAEQPDTTHLEQRKDHEYPAQPTDPAHPLRQAVHPVRSSSRVSSWVPRPSVRHRVHRHRSHGRFHRCRVQLVGAGTASDRGSVHPDDRGHARHEHRHHAVFPWRRRTDRGVRSRSVRVHPYLWCAVRGLRIPGGGGGPSEGANEAGIDGWMHHPVDNVYGYEQFVPPAETDGWAHHSSTSRCPVRPTSRPTAGLTTPIRSPRPRPRARTGVTASPRVRRTRPG